MGDAARYWLPWCGDEDEEAPETPCKTGMAVDGRGCGHLLPCVSRTAAGRASWMLVKASDSTLPSERRRYAAVDRCCASSNANALATRRMLSGPVSGPMSAAGPSNLGTAW